MRAAPCPRRALGALHSLSAVRLRPSAPCRSVHNSKLTAFSEPVSAERPIKFERTLLNDGFRVSHPLPEGKEYLPPRRALRTELTPEEVTEIKELRNEDPFGWSQQALAKRYNVPGELIGQVQQMPQAKRVSVFQGNVPKRRDVIARRRWSASNRIEQGLPPRTELMPEPDIPTYRGGRWVKPNLDARTLEQQKQAKADLAKRMFLPAVGKADGAKKTPKKAAKKSDRPAAEEKKADDK